MNEFTDDRQLYYERGNPTTNKPKTYFHTLLTSVLNWVMLHEHGLNYFTAMNDEEVTIIKHTNFTIIISES